MFIHCKNLRHVRLENGLEKIGISCFYGCGLESVTVPETVKIIAWQAFGRCRQLRNVVFSGKTQLKEVENYAFGGTLLREDRVAFPPGTLVPDTAF